MKGRQRLHSAPVERPTQNLSPLPRLPPYHGLPRIHSSDTIQASVLAHRYHQMKQRQDATSEWQPSGRPRAATDSGPHRPSILLTPFPQETFTSIPLKRESAKLERQGSRPSSASSFQSVASMSSMNSLSSRLDLAASHGHPDDALAQEQERKDDKELHHLIKSAIKDSGTGRRVSIALKRSGHRTRSNTTTVRQLLDKSDSQKQNELKAKQQEALEKAKAEASAHITEYDIQRNRAKERARIRWRLAIQYAIKGVRASNGFKHHLKDQKQQEALPIVNSSTFSEHSHKYSMKGFQTKADLAVNMRVQILMSQHPQNRSPDEIALVERVITPKIRAFSRFNAQQRLELCKRLRYSTYPPGTVVLREGHRAYSFYIILSGQVDVLKKQHDRILKLNILNRGDSFGDIGLEGVLAAVRTASIVASSDIELLVLDREDYCDIVLQGKNAEAEIMQRMKLVKRIPLFRDTCVHETVMHQIVMKAEVKTYEATGAVILEEGEMNRNIYFIVSGSVTVRKTLVIDAIPTSNPVTSHVETPSASPSLAPELVVTDTDSEETTPMLLGRKDATLQIPVLSKNFIFPSDGFEQAQISSEEIAKAEKILGLSHSEIHVHPDSESTLNQDSPTLSTAHDSSLKRSVSGLNLSTEPVEEKETHSNPQPITISAPKQQQNSLRGRSKSAPHRPAKWTRPKTALTSRTTSAKPSSTGKSGLTGKVVLDVATIAPGQSFPEIIPLDMLPESTIAMKVRTSPEKMGMTEDEINEAIDTEIKYKLGDVGYQYPAYSAIVTEGPTLCLVLSRLDFLRVAPPIMIRQLFDRIDECYVPRKTLLAEYFDKMEWEKCRERIIADTYDELKRIKHDLKTRQLSATVAKFVNLD